MLVIICVHISPILWYRKGVKMEKRGRNPGLSGTRDFHYQNPVTRDPEIAMRDHCIVKDGDLWYCTGTSHPVWTGRNPGVRLLISEDLLNWCHHSWLIDSKVLKDLSL